MARNASADYGNISLRVPRKRITEFCKRHGYGDLARKTGRAREQFLVTSDTATVLAYNSQFRGFANYYSFANDNKRALGVLELVVFRIGTRSAVSATTSCAAETVSPIHPVGRRLPVKRSTFLI